MKKCLVGLLCLGMAVTATLGQVATLPISESYTAKQDWTALPGWTGVSIGSYADGRAQFNGNNDSLTVNFDAAPGTLTFDLKGNASTTGTAPTQFDVEESANGNSWSPIASIGEEQLSTSYNTFGPYTLNSDSRFVRWTYVNKYAFNIGLNNVHITSGGPAVFTVVLDKANGFTVEQGTNAVIEAEALNGVAPIDYVWTTDMDPNEYGTFPGDGDGFWIKDNASTGTYYATVTATDSSSPAQTASNTVTFSVIPQAVKYQITINPSINGTVTTTPADEAAANTTVTVNTTPSGGYAVGTITVNGGAVTVSGNTFVMPAEAVTITVTFVESSTSGALIISQYYEGTGYNKWIEIYNPGSSAVDLAAGEYRLGQFSNENRETWKTDGTPSLTVPLSGSIPAAGTYLVGHSSASNPVYAVANQTAGWGFNGDDSVVLYTGGTYAFANVVDAFGLTGNTAKDKSFVRKTSVTSGVNTDFNAADWDEFTLAQVEEAGATVNERVGYHSTGPAEFSVWIDKEDNFTVEQGTAVTFDAETANGVGSPGDYNFVWTTDMDANEYATIHDGFQIKDNASTGTYYATVTVTDLADNTGTATIHFSVVPPAVKYTITINPTVTGTVTTTPAEQAAAGTPVTINATPGDGYAVGAITVTAADMSNVPVDGNTFIMPTQAVTVDVTFVEYTAPDVLITFEDKTLPTGYAPNTALLEDGKVWSTERVVRGNLEADKKIDTLSARMAPVTGTNAVLQLTEAYANPISRISYSVASYGSDNMANVTLTVEVSADGLDWAPVETLTGAEDITATMTEHVVGTIPTNAVYLRFVATAQAAKDKRVNIDNIAINLGEPIGVIKVNIAGNLSGTVNSPMNLVITLQNAIADDWWFTLKDPDNQDDYSYNWNAGTGEFLFTPSKVGNYTLTAQAVDAGDNPIANKTVTLAVSAATDVSIPPIVIVPGGFTFELPEGYTLASVYGADTVVEGDDFTWVLLTSPTDYVVEGTTVTIKTDPAQRRLFRIYWQ